MFIGTTPVLIQPLDIMTYQMDHYRLVFARNNKPFQKVAGKPEVAVPFGEAWKEEVMLSRKLLERTVAELAAALALLNGLEIERIVPGEPRTVQFRFLPGKSK